jgi:hypothetical protein
MTMAMPPPILMASKTGTYILLQKTDMGGHESLWQCLSGVGVMHVG